MFQRLWMRTAAGLAAALALGLGTGCQPAQPVEARDVVPELMLEGVRFRVWRGADLRVEGEARTATLERDSTLLRARDVVAVLPRGGDPVRIAAPEGSGVLSAHTFEAHGGVTVRHRDDVARTPSARYTPEGEGGMVRGDQALTVDGRGYRLEGTGFVLDAGTGELTLGGSPRLTGGGELR